MNNGRVVDALIDRKGVCALKTGRIVNRTKRSPLRGNCMAKLAQVR